MFNRIDRLVTQSLYARIALPVTDADGQEVWDRATGDSVTQEVFVATLPIAQLYLGALETDPISVTGALHLETNKGEVGIYDIDKNWGSLTYKDVTAIVTLGLASAKAVIFQTIRMGPTEGMLFSLSGSEDGIALAESLGLNHQVRQASSVDGVITEAGAMEIVLSSSLVASALMHTKLKSKGRIEMLNGAVTKGTQANPHLSEIAAYVKQYGSLPSKVAVATPVQAARATVSSDFASRLANAATSVVQRQGRGGNFNGSRRTSSVPF